jgi:hypothetical protein
MRTLLVLVLLVIVGVGGFLSRPSVEAHRKHADEVLTKDEGGDVIGGLIESLAGGRTDSFEDMMIATKLTTMGKDAKPVLECWGAFTAFFCSKPAAEKKPA